MARRRVSSNGVAQYHAGYADMAKKWKRCRDVIAGQDAIYLGKTDYLPRLLGEETSEYAARLARTPFFNGSYRTIAGFVGMLFRKAPVLTVPKGLEKFLEDVTLSGTSFNALAKEGGFEYLAVTRFGIFVDHPPLVEGLSAAEAEERGQRPTMTLYKAEAIRNQRYEYRNNKKTLVQVRLDEVVSEADGEFGENLIDTIRVLDLDEAGNYRQRVYDASTGEQRGVDIYPLKNGKFLREIPFYIVGADGINAEYDDPEMIDLFDLNIKLFQAYADYVHACHMTALPTPWVTGYSESPGFGADEGQPKKPLELRIGSATAWIFPDPATKVGFLEYQGQGVEALKGLCDGYKAEMAAIGARMLAPEKSGVEAADTLAMRHSGEQSVLSSAAEAISQGWTEALKMFAEWAGQTGEVKFEINKNFMPFFVTPQQVTTWLAAVQAGRMSAETFFWNMQRADQVPEGLTFEEEQDRIEADPVPRPIPTGHIAPQDEAAAEAARLAAEAEEGKPPKSGDK